MRCLSFVKNLTDSQLNLLLGTKNGLKENGKKLKTNKTQFCSEDTLPQEYNYEISVFTCTGKLTKSRQLNLAHGIKNEK